MDRFRRSLRRVGFTLVEIMIVVVIIGLLAAMGIPALQRVREKSFASRYANDFNQFSAAFQRYALETGQVPPGALGGSIPTGMDGYLPASYSAVSPMGGNYGWSGPSARIVLLNSDATESVMQKVDVILDDGDLTTGEFTMVGTSFLWRLR